MTKPIRVFFSTLSRRFYATRSWREVSPGIVECTGEKFDVTNDIAALFEQHDISFVKLEKPPPDIVPDTD